MSAERNTPLGSNIFQSLLLRMPQAAEELSARRVARRLAEIFAHPNASMQGTSLWLSTEPVRHSNTGVVESTVLGHELSEFFDGATSDSFVDGRSLSEREVLHKSGLPSPMDALDQAGFCNLLLQIKTVVVGGAGEFRAHDVRTTLDQRNQCVAYPSATSIPAQLVSIHDHWSRHVLIEPGWAALVAMVALTNLHPFTDGNGRVARVVFNWTLNQGSTRALYLPIYELSALSRGGYLIRLRQAQYFSQWEPIAQLLELCAAKLFLAPSGTSQNSIVSKNAGHMA